MIVSNQKKREEEEEEEEEKKERGEQHINESARSRRDGKEETMRT